MCETGADTLLWQTAASVAIPGFTINRVVALSQKLLKNVAHNQVRRWGPTVIGLGAFAHKC